MTLSEFSYDVIVECLNKEALGVFCSPNLSSENLVKISLQLTLMRLKQFHAPLLQDEVRIRRMSTGVASVYSRGQSRHAHSPLSGIHGVSMPIVNHPASEANMAATSNNNQYDGRGISPVSVEEYEGFKS